MTNVKSLQRDPEVYEVNKGFYVVDYFGYFVYYVQDMNIFNVSASELKKNAANILNDVYFEKKTAIISRYGKIIANIVPADGRNKDVRSILDKYFGILPDFPDVVKKRSFRKRNIKL